jgi:regulator of sigma E protease
MPEVLNGLPDPMVQILTLLLALFPLVIVHEFGHFLLAKLNHIRVEEFGIGFPPRAITFLRAGGTEYTINWLPIGGFVRLAGEDDPSVPGSFASKSKRARAAVLLAGPVANFLLAGLIFMAVAVPDQVPAVRGVGILGVAEVQGSGAWPARDAGLRPYDVVVAVDGQVLADAAERSGESGETAVQTYLQRRIAASAGQDLQLTVLRGIRAAPIAAPGADVALEAAGIRGVEGRRVKAAPPGGPLAVGDVVVSGAGVNRLDGGWLVLRGLQEQTLTVRPIREEASGDGRIGVSISPPVVALSLPPVQAVERGVTLTAMMMQTMARQLVEMMIGRQEVALAGPVRISEMSRDVSRQGLNEFLLFMALLSLNLGVINLLPIPALDGGRLLFIAAEAIRGRRVEPAREAVVHLVGFVLVIGLMAVLTAVELFNLGRG